MSATVTATTRAIALPSADSRIASRPHPSSTSRRPGRTPGAGDASGTSRASPEQQMRMYIRCHLKERLPQQQQVSLEALMQLQQTEMQRYLPGIPGQVLCKFQGVASRYAYPRIAAAVI